MTYVMTYNTIYDIYDTIRYTILCDMIR